MEAIFSFEMFVVVHPTTRCSMPDYITLYISIVLRNISASEINNFYIREV
jgi:hypothetical protein